MRLHCYWDTLCIVMFNEQARDQHTTILASDPEIWEDPEIGNRFKWELNDKAQCLQRSRECLMLVGSLAKLTSVRMVLGSS